MVHENPHELSILDVTLSRQEPRGHLDLGSGQRRGRGENSVLRRRAPAAHVHFSIRSFGVWLEKFWPGIFSDPDYFAVVVGCVCLVALIGALMFLTG